MRVLYHFGCFAPNGDWAQLTGFKIIPFFDVDREEAETASELNVAMEASGIAAMQARGAVDDEQLGVRGNQIRRAIRSFDDAYVPDSISLNQTITNFGHDK